jgi:hypothetical protein
LLVPGIVSRRPRVHALQAVVLLSLLFVAVLELRRPITE